MTIDDYLAGVNAGQRAALEKLRRTIRAAVPNAEECISYGLAAFRLNGRPLVAFGATANHCAFYPMNSTTVGVFQKQLAGFETSKGTIRFQADNPLPASLVRKMVNARIAENGGAVRQSSAPTKAAGNPARGALKAEVRPVLATLKGLSKGRIREEMSYSHATNSMKADQRTFDADGKLRTAGSRNIQKTARRRMDDAGAD